jgi:lambda repressor-like predicted transcriptional regulator
MTPQELKNLLKQKDVTQTALSVEANVTPQAVSLICTGHSRSRRIEKIIARRVQLPHQVIFPIYPEPIKSREATAAA